MINCTECQNFILKEEQKKAQEHINQCPECQNFLKTFKQLNNLDPKAPIAPENIIFSNLFNPKPKKNLSFIKYALPLAAAVLLFLNYLPSLQKPIEKVSDIKILSQKIEQEIDDIEITIIALEKKLLSADSIISEEIESLDSEINSFYEEV